MNGWWEQNAPRALGLYGSPLLANGAVNHEMLGAALGELPFALVFDAGWWFYDYADGGFSKTTRERVEILFKIIVGRAADHTPLSGRNAVLGLREHARRVVEAAKVILEIDPTMFWRNNKRILDGVVEGISPRESCKRFVQDAITAADDESLPFQDAFSGYTRYCKLHNAIPLTRSDFEKEIREEFDQKFGVRLRNDLAVGQKVTRGWRRIALKRSFDSVSERP